MNFDFGEVLSLAWQITWKQRILWAIGILVGFITAMMFPLMMVPGLLFPVLVNNSRTELIFLAPIGFIDRKMNWTLVSIAAFAFLAFIPLFSILTGLSMVFTKSAWVLTYLRLAHRPQTSPLAERATA